MLSCLSLVILGLFSCQDDTPQLKSPCQPADPSLFVLKGSQQALVNTLQKEIWLNIKEDNDAFSRIKLSPKWLGWRKEGVKAVFYQSLSLLRSPDCKKDGLFSEQTAFSIPFVHGFNLLQNTLEIPNTQFRRTQIEAYFDVNFAEHVQLIILQDADGNRYLKLWQAQGVESSKEMDLKLALPQGWSLKSLFLNSSLKVQLTGPIQQLEGPDTSVFMGPLPATFKPEQYGQWQD
jgi:hypothetical protein